MGGRVQLERVGRERGQLDDLDADAEQRDADQPADRQPHEHEGDRADQRIMRKDVAPPEQIEVRDPEREQPCHAAEVDRCGIVAVRLRAVDDEQHRRAEQDRE